MKRVFGFAFKCIVCGTVREEKYYDGTQKYSYCSKKCQYMDMRGDKFPQFKGIQKHAGYLFVPCSSENPRAMRGNIIPQHVHVAEVALGHYLPENAVVHHVNEIKTDNRPESLVICQDERYHRLLHVRMNRKKEFGDPNLKKCSRYKEVKNFREFTNDHVAVDGKSSRCLICQKQMRRRSKQIEKLTHCKNGHLLDELNTQIRADGRRACITCRREAGRVYIREKRKEISSL